MRDSKESNSEGVMRQIQNQLKQANHSLATFTSVNDGRLLLADITPVNYTKCSEEGIS